MAMPDWPLQPGFYARLCGCGRAGLFLWACIATLETLLTLVTWLC